MDKAVAQVIKFKPKATESQGVFLEYIEAAKSLPFMPLAKFQWEQPKWSLEGLAKPERKEAKPTVNFSKHPPADTPIGDFIRAFVCFHIASEFGIERQIGKYTKPVVNFSYIVEAMKNVGVDHPCDLTPEILDDVVALINKEGSGSTKQKLIAIKWITDALCDARIPHISFDWFPSISTIKTPSRLNKDDSDKVLSDDELDAIIEAFILSKTPMQRIVSSVYALLCCAAMRIEELLLLPNDCDIVLDPGDDWQAGLRWWPKKGGVPSIKWVPSAMVPVAKKALQNIKDETESARQLAKDIIEGKTVIDRLPKHFPYTSEEKRVAFDQALFSSHKFLVTGVKPTNFMKLEAVSYNQINLGITAIFEQLGITLPDGSTPKLNTHKPRHYLNTLANKSSVPQADIAKWSGRKSLQQNETYDHETAEELVKRIVAAKGTTNKLPIPKISKQKKFDLAQIKETAHTNLFGWCIQSLRQNPCEMCGSCIDCTQLVCVKGAEPKLENIRLELDRTIALKEKAQEKIDSGLRVNVRWMNSFNQKIERLEQLISILESEQVVDGSFVMISDMLDLPQYSPIQDAISKEVKSLKKSNEHDMEND